MHICTIKKCRRKACLRSWRYFAQFQIHRRWFTQWICWHFTMR